MRERHRLAASHGGCGGGVLGIEPATQAHTPRGEQHTCGAAVGRCLGPAGRPRATPTREAEGRGGEEGTRAGEGRGERQEAELGQMVAQALQRGGGGPPWVARSARLPWGARARWQQAGDPSALGCALSGADLAEGGFLGGGDGFSESLRAPPNPSHGHV